MNDARSITEGEMWNRFGRKIAFRFSFLLLGSSTFFCWNMLFFFASPVFGQNSYDVTALYKLLVKPLYWLDRHLYHTGYNPELHTAFPQDNHFGVVFYYTLLLIAVVGTIGWTLADRTRRVSNYNRLNYWFRIYMRYILAMVMFSYGLAKLIPVQMPFPDAEDLLTPLSETGRFLVLWNFMGVAPGYMILTGASEIVGSLLLVNRRTMVLGYLIQLAILTNVVAFNIFYNVPVKMFSTQLLVYALFLLAPYGHRLWQFFARGQAVTLKEEKYVFRVRGKKYALTSLLLVVPFLLVFLIAAGFWQRYKGRITVRKNQKIYTVIAFVAKDTLPSPVTDTLRWKRLVLLNRGNAIVYTMRDGKDHYEYTMDSNKRTFILHDSPDTLNWAVFNYSYPAEGELLLRGKWKGLPVSIRMESQPLDSLPINKEKIKWVRD